jgi:hypothetical protein
MNAPYPIFGIWVKAEPGNGMVAVGVDELPVTTAITL